MVFIEKTEAVKRSDDICSKKIGRQRMKRGRKMNSLNLERVELCEIEMPLRAPFETSFGKVSKRRILIVRVFDRDGAIGYGECTAPEQPFYNHETIDTA